MPGWCVLAGHLRERKSGMTDGGAAFRPDSEDLNPPYRPRGAYAGYRAFGSADGAVLVEPQVARKLRSAAEFATLERRITGGLLYGRGWADEQGAYLVVDGYLEAGPGENSGDRISHGTDRFTLSAADLRLLREDAARMYSSSLEAGWWRTRGALGEFGPQDFVTQAELVGPGGVGLLVYGSGIHWGTAYLGPDGYAPDSAGTLVEVPAPVSGPDLAAGPEAGLAPGPEVVDIAAGETLAPEPLPADAGPAPAAPQGVPPRRRRVRRSAAAPVRTVTRRWVARPASPDVQGQETPGDVQFVVGALIAVIVAAAVIIGVLVSSVIVAVVIAVVGILVILGSVWMSRR
ncbi:MAG: hypothetical protein JWO75_4906 [Actinomycetia bacterium]|nr:hypothetical protein [Actinomycetes bacterium]